jgi:hypothetical protein
MSASRGDIDAIPRMVSASTRYVTDITSQNFLRRTHQLQSDIRNQKIVNF